MTPQTSELVQLDLASLRRSVTGPVIGPDDAEYDAARTVMLGGVDARPAVIVRVADTDDVRDGDPARPRDRPRPRGPLRRPQRSGPWHGGRRHRPRRPRPQWPRDRRGVADRVGRQRPDRGGVHHRRGGARTRDRVRRHRLGRSRRDHDRWRDRLPRAEARAHRRQPARGGDRDGRRRGPHRRRGPRAGPVLGDPRGRRQLRGGDAVQVPPPPGAPGRRWHAVPARDRGHDRGLRRCRPGGARRRCRRSRT